ncbi:hypothetical protein FHL15_003806 [Xylaria flabelliformis]|uniref:Zn(2)-C6 fungal-type domain-containing protein n=1 Tax=Xylaria flabelliformis TaxID=2512241 RepID=A0A553I4I3_9PEZI|nr:hypothetical protein FHL15_003806 [Xylaria flabelliformis]
MIQLIVLRGFQGVGASGTYALMVVFIYGLVPATMYTQYTAITMALLALAFALGPILGGLINELSTWKWAFLLNVPAGFLSSIVLHLAVPSAFPHQGLKKAQKGPNLDEIDFLGVFLMTTALSLTITSLEQAASTLTWTSAVIFGPLVAAGPVWVAFLFSQWYASRERPGSSIQPVFPWRFTKNRVLMALFLYVRSDPHMLSAWSAMYGFEVLVALGFGAEISVATVVGIQCRIFGSVIVISITTAVGNGWVKNTIRDVVTPPQIRDIFRSTAYTSTLPESAQYVVRSAFVEGFNLQMRIVLDFAVASVFSIFLMWQKSQIRAEISTNPPCNAMTFYNTACYNMNNSASDSEPQRVMETGKRAFKANKACMPCRAQKLKCDAAVTGLPCSRCTSKQCVVDCILPVRKRRSTLHLQIYRPHPPVADQTVSINLINLPSPIPRAVMIHPIVQNGKTVLLLETVDGPSYTIWTTLTIDILSKKVSLIYLPHAIYKNNRDALVKTYFDQVFPFVPVINRADFIRGYQSGNCSLFLLHAILTPASLHAPADVLSACGFASRSAAQESFFSKARLLHDLAAEVDPLVMLQGSIILCMVILDHPTDRDFSYWLHNAVRLATKLDLRSTCVREDKPRKVLRLYRRIWWALYSLDIFHVFINTKRSRLLEDTPAIKPRTEDDWEPEDVSGASSDLLSALTPQQKALPVIYCELSRIFGESLSIVTNKPPQDPHQMLHPLDTWRRSLSTRMHVDENNKNNIYYLNVQAISYRFECILCRLVQRCSQQFRHADWSEWAKQRLRTAILELDTIVMRVLASGTLQDFPIAFITTVPALLALNIESTLDPAETDLVRSMVRISISQAMLVLAQGKEIPVLRRALPIFEEILAKKKLYLVSSNVLGQASTQSQSQDNSTADTYASPSTQANVVPPHQEEYENSAWFDLDSLGFDFLDESQIGQLGFTS